MKHFMINAGERIEKICDKAVLTLGAAIFATLSYYSMRYTELFREGTEIIETHTDSVSTNLMGLAGVLLLFSCIRILLNRMDLQKRSKVKHIVKVVALLYVAIISMIWVSISHMSPRADAGIISLAAELIGQGEYSTMFPHGYLGHNPHQYGLALILEILYFFFGAGNYLSFAYFNALCMPLLVYAGYKILHSMYENDVMEIFYFLLMASCGPLYIYVLHIYGEITSITFCMVLIWQTLRFCKTGHKRYVLGMLLSAVLSCMLRMNSVIVLIAVAIILVLHFLREKKAVFLLLTLCMVLSVLVVNAGIKKMYELRTGVEIGGGIPHISYILMGLEDTEAGPGWFNGTNYSEYAEQNFDHDLTAASSMAKTKMRLKELWGNKGAAINFFKRKVLTQWNAPDYNSFYTVEEFTCEPEELPWLTQSVFMGGMRLFLDKFFNIYQFVIYVCVAVFLISGFFSKKPIENHLLIIAIIGGFLFSIMWEAMSRYILPYLAFSVPLAAAGIYMLQEWGLYFGKYLKSKEEFIKPVATKAGDLAERISNKALSIMGFLIFAGLAFFSLIQSEFFIEGTEVMEIQPDSSVGNILGFAGILALFSIIRFLLNRMDTTRRSRIHSIVKTGCLLFAAFISIVWVAISHVSPRADAGILCQAAEMIGSGEYSTMFPHGYMGHNPHQYGLVLILEILYFFFGTGNYLPFAYLNALCMPLLIYAGYKILHYIYENDVLEIYYFLLMTVCGPLYLYVIHIYGEITSVTLCMILIWQAMRYCRTESKWSCVIMLLSGALACAVRMNSLIVLIAVAIVMLIYSLRKSNFRIWLLLLCMFISVSATNAGVRTIYEVRTGIEITGGMPHISYILMGLEDSKYGPGWFNSTNYMEHEANEYDTEATTRSCIEKIKGKLAQFAEDKSGALDFFGRKILTQWNAPDYNAFDTVEEFTCEPEELPEFTRNIFQGDVREFLNTFFDRYQFVIYLSVAILMVAGAKHQNGIENHVLLVAIIGGFLFSVLWEAKSRYVLPYLAFAVPLAAAGIYMLQEWILRLIRRQK